MVRQNVAHHHGVLKYYIDPIGAEILILHVLINHSCTYRRGYYTGIAVSFPSVNFQSSLPTILDSLAIMLAKQWHMYVEKTNQM